MFPNVALNWSQLRDLRRRVQVARRGHAEEGRRAGADPRDRRSGGELLDVDAGVRELHCHRLLLRFVEWTLDYANRRSYVAARRRHVHVSDDVRVPGSAGAEPIAGRRARGPPGDGELAELELAGRVGPAQRHALARGGLQDDPGAGDGRRRAIRRRGEGAPHVAADPESEPAGKRELADAACRGFAW